MKTNIIVRLSFVITLSASYVFANKPLLPKSAVTRIFLQLREFGYREKEAVRKRIQETSSDTRTPDLKQYVSYVVLSKADIENYEKQTINMNNNEVKVLLNTEVKSKRTSAGKAEQHGEFKFIHRKHVAISVRKFKERNALEHPYLFMFSYYIPCFGAVTKLSCAEELAAFYEANRDNLTLSVAFQEEFDKN